MKALELFCGAGGMALGAKLAGVSVVQSIENDKHAAQTYSHNFPETQIYLDSIVNFSTDSLSFKPDMIFGGPPCQGYSTSNQRTRSKDNAANWLFMEFLRIISEVEPEWAVMENVKGLVETDDKFFLDSILGGFKSLNYHVDVHILNAVNLGVPQKRSRLFIIGNKIGRKIRMPEKNTLTPITVDEAIGDLPTLSNGANIDRLPYSHDSPSEYAQGLRGNSASCTNNLVTLNAPHIIERYMHVPQGGNWENIPMELMENYKDRTRCHTGIYHRLRRDSPSVVIGNFRKNMLIHPVQNRGLSVREAARIQSFPDWFEFKGTIGFQQQQVGNAVPPLLAKYVFDNIIKA